MDTESKETVVVRRELGPDTALEKHLLGDAFYAPELQNRYKKCLFEQELQDFVKCWKNRHIVRPRLSELARV